MTTEPRLSELWAITSYFNPVGYRRRRENYRLFRERLAVPLVTVELSYDGNFQLREKDADVLLQIRGRDVMWQKERLLNLAARRVPANCRKIAWIDCDVIFQNDEWVERAIRSLDEFPLVHLFHEQHNLPQDIAPDQICSWTAPSPLVSVVCKTATGEAAPEDFCMTDAPLKQHPMTGLAWAKQQWRRLSFSSKRYATTGLAWAGRREVLLAHGLYDGCVLGGADRAVLCAALGKFAYAIRASRMNPRWEAHYLAWARPFHATILGRVGCVPGCLYHLWHGELKNRQYGERHRALETFHFDPVVDIAAHPDGCWQWNSDKTEMHRFVHRYFESRKEDGA